MALATQHFDLYIIPNTTPPPVLDISQYDTSRTFVGHVKDIHGKPYTLPNSTTALLEGRNGNGIIFRLNASVNGDTITFTPDDILTDTSGRIHATISLDSTGQYLSPLRIIFNIQRAGITKEERTTNPDFKDAVAAAFQAYIDEHGSGGGSSGSGEMNVQSDWNQTNINSDAYIKNKPTKLSDFINDENFITEEDLPNTDNFPIYTPQDFGAVGDMEHDDTQAFKDAFAASSRGGTVFVPDGRYRLTDTIRISRWGMMVLSGSVELRFFDMEDGNGGWKPCIKMLLYSRLKGNGSLVIVDYDYKGHAIELYPDEDPLQQPNEPFGDSNPAWRQSREVDNIAILKRASANSSAVAVTDLHNIGGDGIYIGAPTKIEYPHVAAKDSRNYQWTTHVNAKIAGGFENGFHLELKDKNESWMSDTYISGVVESAETAVLIDKVTGGVYCDVIFQPMKCYPDSAYLPVWKQPTSTSNAYAVGARVHYPSSSSPIYESDISNNMNSPDGEGWHRAQEYIDDPRQLYPVWDSNKTSYQIGDRVHYPTETDPVYENDIADNTSIPTGNGWHRAIQDVPCKAFAFVKNGIKVISSWNVDMSRSKIWDFYNENTLIDVPDKDGNYSHKPYALFGGCRGAVIHDFGFDKSTSFDSRIYTNSFGNLLTATIYGAKGIIPTSIKYAFYKNYFNGNDTYNAMNVSWRDPQNLQRYQVPINFLYPGTNANQLYQLGYFDFAGAEISVDGVSTNEALVRQTITIEENDNRGLYGYTNLFFDTETAEMRWNPIGYGTSGHIPIYYYSIAGENNERRYIYRLVRDNTDIQQIYNCALSITNARRFVFEFENKGAIGSLSSDTYKLIQPKYADNVNLYGAGMVAMQNGRPMICTQSATFNRDGTPSTAAVVKELALAENSSGGSSAASNFVTPEQFGAVGDGVTDDTVAIQAAFDAAANGGTVQFGRNKTYLVSCKRSTDDPSIFITGGYTRALGSTSPAIIRYMLKIHGSITILGNGATLQGPIITQQQYNDEWENCYTTNGRSASMIFIDNAEKRISDPPSNYDNITEINDKQRIIIHDLIMDGGMGREDPIFYPDEPKIVQRNLNNAGGAGRMWKAINAIDARGLYLELDRVRIREFAAEGVHAMTAPESVFKAFGCTFKNCTPSGWNVGGVLSECVGCTFIQDEPCTFGAEYVSTKNIFDSCTFNIQSGLPALNEGDGEFNPDMWLIVRNCTFNRSSYRFEANTERNVIYTKYSDNIFIDSCVFNDEYGSNPGEPVMETSSLSTGKVSNCTFRRDTMAANNSFYVLRARDTFNNSVYVNTFPTGGAAILGRGLLIKLTGLSKYIFTKITSPKSITISPVSDCKLIRWGFGYNNTNNTIDQAINVDMPLYAHTRMIIPIDYSSLSHAPTYDSYSDTLDGFFIECSGTVNITVET